MKNVLIIPKFGKWLKIVSVLFMTFFVMRVYKDFIYLILELKVQKKLEYMILRLLRSYFGGTTLKPLAPVSLPLVYSLSLFNTKIAPNF